MGSVLSNVAGQFFSVPESGRVQRPSPAAGASQEWCRDLAPVPSPTLSPAALDEGGVCRLLPCKVTPAPVPLVNPGFLGGTFRLYNPRFPRRRRLLRCLSAASPSSPAGGAPLPCTAAQVRGAGGAPAGCLPRSSDASPSFLAHFPVFGQKALQAHPASCLPRAWDSRSGSWPRASWQLVVALGG